MGGDGSLKLSRAEYFHPGRARHAAHVASLCELSLSQTSIVGGWAQSFAPGLQGVTDVEASVKSGTTHVACHIQLGI